MCDFAKNSNFNQINQKNKNFNRFITNKCSILFKLIIIQQYLDF